MTNWQSGIPTEDGHYWVRALGTGGDNVYICEVSMGQCFLTGDEMAFRMDDVFGSDPDYATTWIGPIEVPR